MMGVQRVIFYGTFSPIVVAFFCFLLLCFCFILIAMIVATTVAVVNLW